jgi:hypothetical protein
VEERFASPTTPLANNKFYELNRSKEHKNQAKSRHPSMTFPSPSVYEPYSYDNEAIFIG